MPADSGDLADRSAIERDHERRLRLALHNRRQRELYGPKHRRRRREFARRLERGEVFVCPRCSMPIGPDSAVGLGPRRSRSLMDTPGAQNLQPRCRECAEDLARVVKLEGQPWYLTPTSGVLGRLGEGLPSAV